MGKGKSLFREIFNFWCLIFEIHRLMYNFVFYFYFFSLCSLHLLLVECHGTVALFSLSQYLLQQSSQNILA